MYTNRADEEANPFSCPFMLAAISKILLTLWRELHLQLRYKDKEFACIVNTNTADLTISFLNIDIKRIL